MNRSLIAFRRPAIAVMLLLCAVFCQAQYHLRVELFDKDIPYYCLSFTNDNWKTKEQIRTTFDISGDWEAVTVVYNPKLFTGCNSASGFGKQFKTYQSCLNYNTTVYKKYLAQLKYRKKHPIPVPKIPEVKIECKTKSVY